MSSLIESLSASLDSEGLAPSELVSSYAIDGVVPEAAVFPGSVQSVSEVLSLASRHGKAVAPWGGGTQVTLGNPPERLDLVVGLRRLNRITLHEPADLVASAEAGLSLQVLQEELARDGQFLPLEAPVPDRATIGGVLAANASGPSRLAYGAARDWLIGIKVVHADGVITKSGGRVVKNVTGYDLNKLYTGSLGTLGVIVEATFKIAPIAPHGATLVADYATLKAGVVAAHGVLGQDHIPTALHVVNREALGRLSGVDGVPQGEAVVLVQFTGRKAAVERKSRDTGALLRDSGAGNVDLLSRNEGDLLWQAVTDLGWAQQEPELAMKVNVLPSEVESVLDAAAGVGEPALVRGIVADVGSGLVRFLWWGGSPTVDLDGELRQVTGHMRALAKSHSGHAVVERCPLRVKAGIDVWGNNIGGLDVMRRIKSELDPAGILNPGRFAGGI